MLEQLLSRLGFTKKETSVYLALLQYGSMSPADIAKRTGISRPTVYSVSRELVKKGVLLEDLGDSHLLLSAKQPEDFITVVNREQRKLDEKRNLVEKTICELQKIAQKATYTVPKIVFIPEEDLECYLYKQSAAWTKSILKYDCVWWGFQDHTLVEHFMNWITWYWKEAAPPQLTLNLLTNAAPVENIIQLDPPSKRRTVKFWKHSQDFTATTWVAGDYVIMAVTNQHPHYLVEIHDQILAHNLRELFKGMWSTVG